MSALRSWWKLNQKSMQKVNWKIQKYVDNKQHTSK